MKSLLMMSLMILSLSSCSTINSYLGLSDDNYAEEAIEAIIKHEVGIDLDLTPSSKE